MSSWMQGDVDYQPAVQHMSVVKKSVVLETFARLTGFKGEIVWDRSKPNGQPRRKLDVSRAREMFGFQSQTSFEDRLRRTIDWYLTNRHNQGMMLASLRQAV